MKSSSKQPEKEFKKVCAFTKDLQSAMCAREIEGTHNEIKKIERRILYMDY
jgi:hypothetical protein